MTKYEYHSFSEEKVQEAISSARSHYAGESEREEISNDNGRLQTFAECLTLQICDNKLCLDLPFELGKICIPTPILCDGKPVEVCVYVCTFWGIPTGVVIVISCDGIVIARKVVGDCS